MTSLLRPRALLRLEGAAGFALALLLYGRLHGGWLLFVVLILAPDLSLLGYLAGNRTGAACYNAVHTLVWPAVLAGYGVFAANSLIVQVALIWFAHIAGDRLLGYGLKYPDEFKKTHLQRL